MTHPLRGFVLFSLSCCITTSIWWMRTSQHPPTLTVSQQVPAPAPEPWTELRLTNLLRLSENASTDSERLAAVGRLSEIPKEKLSEALGLTPLIKDRDLTFTAKMLLILWGGADGGAASRWAWHRFREEQVWDEAFREIGPSWASKDQKGFAQWVIAHKQDKPLGNITLEMALASDEPILDFSSLDKASTWLILEDPQAAFQVRDARGGMSNMDGNLAATLDSVEKVRQALLAFDHLDEMTPGRYSGRDLFPLSLFARWNELDPEGFSRTPFARFDQSIGGKMNMAKTAFDLQTSLKNITTLPQEERQAAFVRSYTVWTKTHPGEQPDRTGWSATQLRMWDDLDALRVVDGK